MVLSQFGLENINPILSEGKKFANTIYHGGRVDAAALRDEAAEILISVRKIWSGLRVAEDQEAKSKGQAFARASHHGCRNPWRRQVRSWFPS